MSINREAIKKDFKSYYDHFVSFNPLDRKRERFLLSIIKGQLPAEARIKKNSLIDSLWRHGNGIVDEFDLRYGLRKNHIPTREDRKEALATFILHNMRLVLSRVSKIRSQDDPEAMSLVSYGLDGLLRAIDLFDINRGTRFSTYAVHWIDSLIRKAAASGASPKAPRARKLNRLYKRGEKHLKELTGEHPDSMAVASFIGWGLKTLTDYHTSAITNIPAEIANLTGNCNAAEDDAATSEAVEALREAFHVLTPVEEEIIRKHFGVGAEVETLQSLAARFNVTKERIRQIENHGIEKMYLHLRQFRYDD